MSNWAIQRARFNHDKLKNQFLQSVVRLVRALEARTLDQEFVDDFICQLPSNWAKLETKALDLLDRAESETGPPAWFRTYPLSRLNSKGNCSTRVEEGTHGGKRFLDRLKR
jgi:hypothetical protein